MNPPSQPDAPAHDVNPRSVAVDLLERVERDAAYANLVLASAQLPQRHTGFITQLFYGTIRMRRALDYLIDGFVDDPPDLRTRNLLRIGTYQLHFLATPAHAAVSETVAAAPRRVRGFVNAVLRRVADTQPRWPGDAIRLSYPDWLAERLIADVGSAEALAAMEAMNRPAQTHTRPDGYVQDLASQWTVELVGAQPHERILDLCAGPGGKATGLARSGAAVTAMDAQAHRAGLVAKNATRTGADLAGVVTADGRQPPVRPGSFHRVLVDAPCSGLGVLGRRADARWRVQPDDVDRLARLQAQLVRAAFSVARPGGLVVYSVCTMTQAETVAIDRLVAQELPAAVPVPVQDERWRPWGRGGGLLLPQDHHSDAMAVFCWRAPI